MKLVGERIVIVPVGFGVEHVVIFKPDRDTKKILKRKSFKREVLNIEDNTGTWERRDHRRLIYVEINEPELLVLVFI